jgi:hypothetical protein
MGTLVAVPISPLATFLSERSQAGLTSPEAIVCMAPG